MSRLIYETRRDGCDVCLATDERGMVAEVRRRGVLLAKSESWHWGLWDARAPNPERSGLAKLLMDEALGKALGRPHKSSFDLLCDEIARGMARQKTRQRIKGKRVLLAKSLLPKRVLILKSEPPSLSAAALLSRRPQRVEAPYQPNAPVNDTVLRRVLVAAKRGVLTADDLHAVQDAHRDGLALPSHVLRKLAEVRQ